MEGVSLVSELPVLAGIIGTQYFVLSRWNGRAGLISQIFLVSLALEGDDGSRCSQKQRHMSKKSL